MSRAAGVENRVGILPTRLVRSALLFASLVFIVSACGLASSGPARVDGWVEIQGKRTTVEIAYTPEEQAMGLGERDALAWGHGMYFEYDRPGFYSFWMKGMRFSIDIVWLRGGRIIDLDPNVPFERGTNGPTLRPAELADAVLEVPAGYAVAQGWRIGDRVKFERTRAR